MATVVYGVRRKVKIDKSLGVQACPNCGHTVELSLARETKMGHIYYIPLLPLPSLKIKACPNCGLAQIISNDEYKQLKNS